MKEFLVDKGKSLDDLYAFWHTLQFWQLSILIEDGLYDQKMTLNISGKSCVSYCTQEKIVQAFFWNILKTFIFMEWLKF